MASRQQLLQHQNTAEAAVPKGGQNQKNGAAEKKNRPALCDIGNLVTIRGVDGKPIPNISRPITRGFCAQLAKQQAAAAANCKNPLVTNRNEANAVPPVKKAMTKKAVAQKPQEKKAASKPDPKEIVEISPDSEKIAEKETCLDKAKAGERSLKKKAPTLSSILTARSKAACGLPYDKSKEQIVDIDAADRANDLAVGEYIEEMYKFYKSIENENRAPYGYMNSQPELNEKMRAILIDWLVQVHDKLELSPETLYLTINIIDRYLASKMTTRWELQLVGMGAILIASKYEEIWAPEVNELVNISDRTYTCEQVLGMEKRILGALEWNLTVPTPYVFLVRFIKASMTGSDVENMVYFLAELGVMNYETVAYCPSMIAAAAVYAARYTLNKTPAWNETLKRHTGLSEVQVKECGKVLVRLHALVGEDRLKGVYRKYSSSEHGGVALVPAAKSLLAA